MDAYTSFAQVYDLFMDNVPYEEWSDCLGSLLAEYGITEGTVVELGCGTGKMTRLMAAKGYDMIGVDNSLDMLEIARQDSGEEDILYLLQDMQELELYGSVSAVYSACDSMNYLLQQEDLRQVFVRTEEYLEPGGLFVFDMNSPYKYRELLGENTFAESREESSFIWENYFDEESQVNEYDLILFIQEQNGLFRKFEETHFQRCYEPSVVRTMLEQNGFEILGICDDYSRTPGREDSERLLFIARKK